MIWFIERPVYLFPVLLVGLFLCVNLGFRFRRGKEEDEDDAQLESARNGLNVLLSLHLGFTLPMAQPHYDARRNLIVDEADAISTVHLRAEMLPDPFRGQILDGLREYLSSRIDFGREDMDEATLRDSLAQSTKLLRDMQQEAIGLVEQSPNSVTPIFVQSLNDLSDLTEKRLAAEENRVPSAIWLMVILISVMASLVTGYSMRRRQFVDMIVLPLTVAIVMSLVADLDSPRTGVIHIGQQSLERLQAEFNSRVP